MKLSNTHNTYLKELLSGTIENIEITLSQNGIDEVKMNKMIEEGNYELEEVKSKITAFKEILEQLDNVSEPGASFKQISSLEKVAKKKKEKTQEKIENAIHMLLFINKKISVYSVSQMASVSYNTAKQYSKLINLHENNRLKLLAS